MVAPALHCQTPFGGGVGGGAAVFVAAGEDAGDEAGCVAAGEVRLPLGCPVDWPGLADAGVLFVGESTGRLPTLRCDPCLGRLVGRPGLVTVPIVGLISPRPVSEAVLLLENPVA
jgi:hypothetical protein